MEKLGAEGQSPLIVDSGDLFFEGKAVGEEKEHALAKARLIARAYQRMGAIAVNVGDLDLVMGLDFLRQVASQGLPLISANLLDPKTQKPIFPPYVLREASGVRIAFLGLLSPEFKPFIPDEVKEEIVVKNPWDTVREILPKLKEEADLLVLLSDMGLKDDSELVKGIPGIDFVLGGHDGRFIKWPLQEKDTFIVQSYKKGMYLGKLSITVEKLGVPFRDLGEKDRLDRQIRDLERRIQALERAKERNPKQDMGPAIQRVTEQKAERERELEKAVQASSSGNRFLWTLEPLAMDLPEDKEVVGWMKASGINRD